MKVANVVGACPNFVKVAPIHRQLEKHPEFTSEIIHTGQHYDEEMSDVFFEELGLPEPDRYLGVGSDTHARQTAEVMVAFEEVLDMASPGLVLVVGDVNSTIAAGLVAQKLGIPVGHVEAGLRSFDRSMPEEINRALTDQLADELFATEPSGIYNLAREGIADDKVHFAGNVMIDSLEAFIDVARKRPILDDLGLDEGNFVAVTLHRPSNVDEEESLRRVHDLLLSIGARREVVFPVHPRTKQRLVNFGLWEELRAADGLTLTDPLGYLDFLRLLDGAGVVLTDSGGIQEETTILGTPCLTLRTSTERPVTIEMGTNELVSLREDEILDRLERRLRQGREGEVGRPPLWDGRTAERIVDVLERKYL